MPTPVQEYMYMYDLHVVLHSTGVHTTCMSMYIVHVHVDGILNEHICLYTSTCTVYLHVYTIESALQEASTKTTEATLHTQVHSYVHEYVHMNMYMCVLEE